MNLIKKIILLLGFILISLPVYASSSWWSHFWPFDKKSDTTHYQAESYKNQIKELEKQKEVFSKELSLFGDDFYWLNDQVDKLLPNLIGYLEGQGAGHSLQALDIKQICKELRSRLSHHEQCEHKLSDLIGADKEDIFYRYTQLRQKHRPLKARYTQIKTQISNIDKQISELSSKNTAKVTGL